MSSNFLNLQGPNGEEAQVWYELDTGTDGGYIVELIDELPGWITEDEFMFLVDEEIHHRDPF